MGKTSAIRTREGTLASVGAGVVVQIDPELKDEDGFALSIDEIELSGGFIVIHKTNTFHAQNITTETRTLEWTAKALHSLQHKATQTLQTTVGATGNNPSGLSAVTLATGGVIESLGQTLHQATANLSASQTKGGHANVKNITSDIVLTLPAIPSAGDYFWAKNADGSNNLTLNGNGNNVAGSGTKVLAPGEGGMFMYVPFAPTPDWLQMCST